MLHLRISHKFPSWQEQNDHFSFLASTSLVCVSSLRSTVVIPPVVTEYVTLDLQGFLYTSSVSTASGWVLGEGLTEDHRLRPRSVTMCLPRSQLAVGLNLFFCLSLYSFTYRQISTMWSMPNYLLALLVCSVPMDVQKRSLDYLDTENSTFWFSSKFWLYKEFTYTVN